MIITKEKVIEFGAWLTGHDEETVAELLDDYNQRKVSVPAETLVSPPFGEWINVEDKKPEGACLVELEEEIMSTKYHTATYHKNINVIGGQFEFDMPKVVRWTPLPK